MTIDRAAQSFGFEFDSPFQAAGEQSATSTRDLMEGERWSEAAEQVAFREAVLAAHIERTRRRKGPPQPDLQPSQLATVAGTDVQMASDAAARAGELLQAANQAIAAGRRAGSGGIGATVKVTAQSGYRGSDHQARLWRAYFTRYYNQTDRARSQLPGGPHSPAAVAYMLDVFSIPRRIAAPGYSNHQAGIAIDFRQLLKGADRIRNSTSAAAVARWQASWFFRWLQENAARFAFQPYSAEPWHWEYRPMGAGREHETGWPEREDREMKEPSTGEGQELGPEEAEEEQSEWTTSELENPEIEGWGATESWESEREQLENPEIEGWGATESWESEREQLENPEIEGWGATESWESEVGRPEAFDVGSAESQEGEDLFGELLAESSAEDLDEGEGGAYQDPCAPKAAPTSRQHTEGEVEFEEFAGSEHKAIGDGGSGMERSTIYYGSPPQPLTFGDVVALAGDYFNTYEQLRDIASRPRGRMEVAWARWHCLDLKQQGVPEPTADKPQQQAVIERYFLLASRNLSHFSAGGTAWQAYTFWHAKAIADALEAGQWSDAAIWRRALTKEAFGDHFLTDMFSAGHVRMPRAAIRDWYARQMPGTTDRFLRYMARFIFDRLDERQQLPQLAWWFGWVTRSVMARKIEALGGEAVRTFSLGDIVGLALHDHDGKGLAVVSDVDSDGHRIPGGHRWTAVGDSHLGSSRYGAKTKAMATAAVITSLRDLERVRGVGVKLGRKDIPLAHRTAAVKQALGGPIFAARGFVPREDTTAASNASLVRADGGKAALDWRWGQLGDVAYRAVDETVKGKIANQLNELACNVSDPVSGPLGLRIYGTRSAFRSFVKHLRTEGITAIENAVGKAAH